MANQKYIRALFWTIHAGFTSEDFFRDTLLRLKTPWISSKFETKWPNFCKVLMACTL